MQQQKAKEMKSHKNKNEKAQRNRRAWFQHRQFKKSLSSVQLYKRRTFEESSERYRPLSVSNAARLYSLL